MKGAAISNNRRLFYEDHKMSAQAVASRTVAFELRLQGVSIDIDFNV